MADVLKTINNALRVIFIGFIGLYAIIKLFDRDKAVSYDVQDENREYVTSEFDDIW